MDQIEFIGNMEKIGEAELNINRCLNNIGEWK
jgi:hypothetical protein